MITVMLYGHLAKAFGRRHRFAIRTPAQAVSALCANFPAFRSHVIERSEPGYRVLVGKEPRDLDTLSHPADDVIRIVPVTQGAGRGLGSIILGAALIFAAPYAAGWLLGNTSAVGLAIGVANYGPVLGGALILSGVSQMLFKPPSIGAPKDRPNNRPSFVFDGPVNTAAQGNPVPVCYGQLLVGSQVISAGLTTELS